MSIIVSSNHDLNERIIPNKGKTNIMSITVSSNKELNEQVISLDDQRRRLGLASLRGKIQSSLALLTYAEKVCGEAIVSYDDPKMTEAHLYSCMEGIFAAFSEVNENSQLGIALSQKIIGDRIVGPLDRFTLAMKEANGIV